MPRLTIFTATEINAFERPPHFELEQQHKYFALTEQLLALIKNLKTPTNKLCMIIQWGYFRATGRFFSPKYFRKTDMEYIANKLELPYSSIDIDYYHQKKENF